MVGGFKLKTMVDYRLVSTDYISNILGLNPIGEKNVINGLNLSNRESKHDSILCYINSPRFVNYVKRNLKIKALLTNYECYELLKDLNITFFIADYPEAEFYKLHSILIDNTDFYKEQFFSPIIGKDCKIAKSAILEDNVILGNNVTIGHNSIIRTGSKIGSNTIIGCNTIIGSEGFQAISSLNTVRIIKHVGGCEIGENVFIGDGVTICNSLFEDTTSIGNHTKIDNLVHIAHNCIIGQNNVITAGCIFCGSVIVKDGVWIGPNSTILNKVVIDDKAFVGLGSVVIKNLKPNEVIFGNPAKKV